MSAAYVMSGDYATLPPAQWKPPTHSQTSSVARVLHEETRAKSASIDSDSEVPTASNCFGHSPRSAGSSMSNPQPLSPLRPIEGHDLTLTRPIAQETPKTFREPPGESHKTRRAIAPLVVDAAEKAEKAVCADADDFAWARKTMSDMEALYSRLPKDEAVNERGETQLITDVRERQHDSAERLLNDGANVNAMTPGGWTSLHWAAYNSDLKMLDVLLKRPDVLRTCWTDGFSTAIPLHIAVVHGSVDCLKVMLREATLSELQFKTKDGRDVFALADLNQLKEVKIVKQEMLKSRLQKVLQPKDV